MRGRAASRAAIKCQGAEKGGRSGARHHTGIGGKLLLAAGSQDTFLSSFIYDFPFDLSPIMKLLGLYCTLLQPMKDPTLTSSNIGAKNHEVHLLAWLNNILISLIAQNGSEIKYSI